MPLWTVKLRVNVPGLGDRLVDITSVSAVSMEAAVAIARQAVVVEAMQAQQTAP